MIDNLPVAFQPREMKLLELLARARHQWISIEKLCGSVVGQVTPRKRHLLSQYVYRLRRKLGHWGSYIQFVRGEGYRRLLEIDFVDVVTSEPHRLLLMQGSGLEANSAYCEGEGEKSL